MDIVMKFIYVFDETATSKLLEAGFVLLKLVPVAQ